MNRQDRQTLRRLAVVVPVGPGDRSWRGLLQDFRALAPDLALRLVFAHGDLQARPRDHEVAWTECPRGRARQQNTGAATFDQPWLWFVHADSRLRAQTLSGLVAFLEAGRDALGYFDLRFLDDGPRLMWLTEAGVRLRCRWMQLPFGDQGLLLPSRQFYALGGFDEDVALGEDLALVLSARRHGLPLQRIAAPIYTSARRYAQRGWLATTVRHQWLTWQLRRKLAQ